MPGCPGGHLRQGRWKAGVSHCRGSQSLLPFWPPSYWGSLNVTEGSAITPLRSLELERKERNYFSTKLPKPLCLILWVALYVQLCSVPFSMHFIQVFLDIWRGSVSRECIFVFLHMLLFVSSQTLPIKLVSSTTGQLGNLCLVLAWKEMYYYVSHWFTSFPLL